jgi:hypothetical protein
VPWACVRGVDVCGGGACAPARCSPDPPSPTQSVYSPFKKGGDKGAAPPKGTPPSRLFLAVWSNNLPEVRVL